MNRVLRIKLLVAVLFATILCNAQVTVSTSQLNGTEWKIVTVNKTEFSDDDTSIFKFDISSYIDITSEGVILKRTYYISNTEPSYTYFDECKVGVNATGKYIVYCKNKSHEIDYFTIMSFNGDEMRLFHKAKENTFPGINAYITLKRVNKNE